MNKEEKLKEVFEKEVWLLISGELSRGRKKFWMSKVETNKEFARIFTEAKLLNSEIKKTLGADFTYSNNNAPSKSRTLQGKNTKDSPGVKFRFPEAVKWAAATILIAVIVAVLILMPFTKHETGAYGLTWDAAKIDNEITDIRQRLQTLSFDEQSELKNLIYGKNSFEVKMLKIKNDVLKIGSELSENKF